MPLAYISMSACHREISIIWLNGSKARNKAINLISGMRLIGEDKFVYRYVECPAPLFAERVIPKGIKLMTLENATFAVPYISSTK